MIGKTLGHYRILRKLGEGGMGQVYLAEDATLKRRVALKVLPEEMAGDPDRRSRFEQEARSVAALNHPNIVTLYSIEEADGVPFLTMEFVDGRTLTDVLCEGAFSMDRFFDVAIPLVDALCASHERGIAHRDLKPGNVMISNEGRVKILDFGLAKLWQIQDDADADVAETRTQEGRVLGTLPYMSPEQVQGKPLDHRSDLFSLGIVFYEMCTGRRPFQGETRADLTSSILRDTPPAAGLDLPLDLGRIIRRCLEKDPGRRPQSTIDLRNQLEDLQKETAATGQPPRSIAVLAFTDMSPEKDQDYFCEGMAEEIINALGKVEGLKVASRMSAFQFKAAAGDSREVGERLGVDSLLEGSVRKAGDRLRITVQLINVADGYHLWSERYDRQMKDVFAIQDEIAQNIVEALQVTLSPKEERALRATPTTNVEAYEQYLRGRQFLNRGSRRATEVARQMFMRASRIDPSFARAYAGLADSCSFLCMYHGSGEANLEQALEASAKALELEPELAEAHAARGGAASLSKRYEEADREFETALRLDPKLFEAYYLHARNCWAQGRLDQAAKLFETAAAVRPEDHQCLVMLGQLHRGQGREAEAREAMRRALDVIEKKLEANPDDVRSVYHGASALIYLGQRERALEWARRALAMDPQDPSVLYNVACTYAIAGENEDAIDCLAKAVDFGFAHREWIENDTDFDPLRNHPRFQALLQRIK